ncbi:MAG TPA: hypothetical protein VFJ93_14790 [Gaiellaceae bacterium]|nr:hypothetical protein [Gaiellaceae bacterium]
MATERTDPPDLTSSRSRLVQLRHRRTDVQRRFERVGHWMAALPNKVALAQQKALDEELAEMEQRLLQIRARLLPIRRVV